MKTQFTLYGGPLDGLAVQFFGELSEGDELEFPIQVRMPVSEVESSAESVVVTTDSGELAIHKYKQGELKFIKVKRKYE